MGKVISIAKWQKSQQLADVPDVSKLLQQAYATDGDEALTLYREIIKQDPKCTDAYLNLGVGLYRASKHVSNELSAGMVREARACWRKVIKLMPATDKGHYNLAFTYLVGYRKSDFITAEKHLLLAIEHTTDQEVRLDALYNLGQVYLKLDRRDHRRAWSVYQRYVQLNPIGEDADKARKILDRISAKHALCAPIERSLTLVK